MAHRCLATRCHALAHGCGGARGVSRPRPRQARRRAAPRSALGGLLCEGGFCETEGQPLTGYVALDTLLLASALLMCLMIGVTMAKPEFLGGDNPLDGAKRSIDDEARQESNS